MRAEDEYCGPLGSQGPFYKGGTLEDWLGLAPPPPEDQKQRVLMQILRGIEHMHNNNVVHLDLKPANVFMSTRAHDAVPRVGDFDVSCSVEQRAQEAARTLTMGAATVAVGGTVGYIAPELRQG